MDQKPGKEYKRPQLIEHGDIKSITMESKPSGELDDDTVTYEST